MRFSMSTTPEKCYHCTLWKTDAIKFQLFPLKIGCILNSQLLYHTTTAKSVGHMCAPNIVKTGWFLTEIVKKIKGRRFYWDTVSGVLLKWRSVYAKGRGKGPEGTLLIYDHWGEYTLSKKNPEVGICRIPAYTPPIHHWTQCSDK